MKISCKKDAPFISSVSDKDLTNHQFSVHKQAGATGTVSIYVQPKDGDYELIGTVKLSDPKTVQSFQVLIDSFKIEPDGQVQNDYTVAVNSWGPDINIGV